ncbi:hypothetical protein L208DRAFT_1488872 [Tricholoma matsutake]|nr:hypothetical protein L208DRAFT_1488872 [Tricholoma matsutake 945]
MSYSATYTTLPFLKRMWDALVKQKYLLEKQIQLERSKRAVTGPSHGTQPPKQLSLLSHTVGKNSRNRETTWCLNSPQSNSERTTNLSRLTKQSE